jgi:hypothetical protein
MPDCSGWERKLMPSGSFSAWSFLEKCLKATQKKGIWRSIAPRICHPKYSLYI